MTSLSSKAARRRRASLLTPLLAALLAQLAQLAPASAGAQQGGTPASGGRASGRRGFDLFAVVDFAATGVRSPTGSYRYFVTNSGPMDLQVRQLEGAFPATVIRSGTPIVQFYELTLFAAAAPGDRAANLARVPTLSNASGGGAAISFNFHKTNGLQLSR